MVRTGGSRGRGSGRGATPEAERARRAKISAAFKGTVRVVVVADYRLRLRSKISGSNVRDWTYVSGATYRIRVDKDDTDDPAKLEAILNARYPRRQHFNVRGPEQLD